MRRPSLRLVLGIGIPLLVVLVLLGAWAIDTSRRDGEVPRNVTVAGRAVGGLTEAELRKTVEDVARQYETVPVQVRAGESTFRIAAGELGLALDVDATTEAAFTIDDDRALPAKPFVWLGSLLTERESKLTFTVDDTTLESGLAGLEKDNEPTEPSLVPGSDGLAVVSGTPGRTVDSEGVRRQLLDRASSGDQPIVVTTSLSDEAPTVPDEAAQAVADAANDATAFGLEVTVDGESAVLPAPTVRSWLGSEVVDGAMTLTIDEEPAIEAIRGALPEPTQARDASITVEGGAVKLTKSVTGKACCAPDTAQRIVDAISAGQGSVAIEYEVEEPSFSTEDAEALKIKEPVGSTTEWNGQPQVKSFTTYHPCCAARVTNIHTMADAVRGTLVKPGETFSINEVVGERTTAKGYVSAGAIANGEHVDEVGGGVSQFATTMFNAAYFAGLDITTYQAHSEWFDRYPRGREATMGFPAPDLAWKNNSPYGILVWTSYTDTSLTITLYSTQWATAAQTDSRESRSGRCTVVTTERTVTYPDGTTSTDEFSARYRDEGVTSC
jgi:vancomycin resistance protein YoaR